MYVVGHACINDEKYVRADEEGARLTNYALTHIDECCLIFDKGYSYEFQYQGKKMYTQMMYMTPPQPAAQEYSFELNHHNKTLLTQIGNIMFRLKINSTRGRNIT